VGVEARLGAELLDPDAGRAATLRGLLWAPGQGLAAASAGHFLVDDPRPVAQGDLGAGPAFDGGGEDGAGEGEIIQAG
jgi:hypothetical protein